MLQGIKARFGPIATTLLLTLSATAALAEAEVYGDAIDEAEPTPIAKILADPDAFLGKTVRIEGGILDVCPKKGCWIEIGDAEHHIQLKVDDDVIVFPTDAKGRVAAAQGEVEALELTREKYLGWLAHRAEEMGRAFDAASAEIGEGPYRIIRIRGTGAEIE
ncbi:MAG: DUF4920 domain-containing protein [Acidobacteriota bacterium]